MLRNKGFLGAKTANIWPHLSRKRQIFWKALFNESCLKSYSQYYAIFNFSLNGPIKELRGRPLKISVRYISNTFEKFWWHVEQKMFRIKRPFFWYQEKGAGPVI